MAYRSIGTNYVANSGTSHTGPIVSPTAQVGDTLILAISSGSGTTVTPSGWVNLTGSPTPNTASSGRLYLLTKTCTSGDIGAAIPYTLSATQRTVALVIADDNVVDVSQGTTSTAVVTSPLNAPNVTTTAANDTVYSFYGCLVTTAAATQSVTVATGETEIADITSTVGSASRNNFIAVGYKVFPSAGATGVRGATIAQQTQTGCFTVATLASPAAPVGTTTQIYSGSAFVGAAPKIHNGTTFVTVTVKKHNGVTFT